MGEEILLVALCYRNLDKLRSDGPQSARMQTLHTLFIIIIIIIKQLLDEVEYDIMNYQNRGLCYLPKPKAEADNTDTRF